MKTPYIIYVRNIEQKILYDKELCGQISDGNWENEDTDERLWHCEVIVRPDEIGCSWKVENLLDFNEEFLLDVVGDRMMNYVREINPKYT